MSVEYLPIQDYSKPGRKVDWKLAAKALRQSLEETGTPRDILLRDMLVQVQALETKALHFGTHNLYMALHRLARTIRIELDSPSENLSKVLRLIAYIERLANQGKIIYSPDSTRQALVLTSDPLPNDISNTLIRAGFDPVVYQLDHETQPNLSQNTSVIIRYAGPGTQAADIVRPLAQIRDVLPEITRILFSPDNRFQTRLEALRAGVHHFLPDPANIRHFNDILMALSMEQENKRPYRILMIDDLVTVGTYWRKHLQAPDIEFRFEHKAEQAYEAALSYQPDVILLDLYMPEISGTELARIFRDIESLRDVPILYMSVESGEAQRFEARLQGGDDFLDKEIHHDDLLRMIRYRAQRYRLLRNQMRTDGLTGLLNHVAIRELLAEELDRALRFKHDTAVVMLDIDHFKRVNDEYGHQAGDTVIRGLANLLTTKLRRYDGLGRYGGEEFMIILPNTNAENAVKLMNRLRKDFADMPHLINNKTIYASFSAGVATCPDLCEVSELIEAADKALYKAKREGRNCVRVYHSNTE